MQNSLYAAKENQTVLKFTHLIQIGGWDGGRKTAFLYHCHVG
jgi:hypothetical protein